MSEFKSKFPNVYKFFNDDEFQSTTFINKYLLKDKEGNFLEDDPNQTIERVMGTLAKAIPEEKPSEETLKRIFVNDWEENKDKSWKEVFIEANNKFVGVCPQGSILSGCGNGEERPQSISNCFVVASPHDSIAGIMEVGEKQAHIAKRRGGLGYSLSTLRPDGSYVANAAKTSNGVPGWMEYFSSAGKVIGQGGRRMALMLSLDIQHPDAEKFAEIKQDLTKVTGANVSLQISDEFMECVREDKVFTQQWPVEVDNPSIIKQIKARDLWKVVCECAHRTGEPGVLFFDQIKRNLPANFYKEDGFETISTNPCSEIPLSANDSCRLASISLVKYVNNKFSKSAYFDFNLFERDVRIAMRLMDSVVSEELNCIDRILKKIGNDKKLLVSNLSLYDLEEQLWRDIKEAARKGRRCGLGTHSLGDCLSQLCIKYDSNRSLEVLHKIYSTLRNTAYDESVEMSKEYGQFPVFNWETEKECDFIKRLPKQLKDKIKKHGRRNISILTGAPTGTISIISGTSSGIEPTFRQMYIRRRKINHDDKSAKVDFVDQSGDKWQEFPIFEKNVLRYFDAKNVLPPEDVRNDNELGEYLPNYFITSDKIDWRKRIEIQSILTEYTDHSLSSTVNLPEDTPVKTIQDLYMLAWEKGLKGVTVYRDNCRTGVLVSNEGKTEQTSNLEARPDTIIRVEAPERPKELNCEVHITKVQGEDYVVIVGFLGDSIYEIFAGKYHNTIPKKQFSGTVVKKKGSYFLNYLQNDNNVEVNINEYFENPTYQGITRLVSTALRHHTPVAFIVEQLKKSSFEFTGFEKCLARILKKYAKKEDLARHVLAKAGGDDIEVRFQDGCMTVINHTTGTTESKCD